MNKETKVMSRNFLHELVKWMAAFRHQDLIALYFILFSLLFSPARAQVGTWRAYMSYYEPQQIVKAGNQLFVRASNDLYQYNLTDHSITTFDKITGLSDSYINHIAWNQQAKRLIIVYQNSNIDLMDQSGNVTNVSALYRKVMTEDKTIDSLTIDGVYAYLYARFGIVKVNMQRAEISDTYTTTLLVTFSSQAGTLMEIATALNAINAKVHALHAQDTSDGKSLCSITLEVKDLEELQKIEKKLSGIHGVSSVERRTK